MPTLYPILSRQVMPWKNGGGSTTEILVWPQGADFAHFCWRISLATIATPGPFSSFPGIDRSLSLVSGAGVDLQIEDEGQREDVLLRHPDDRAQPQNGSRAQATVQFRGEAKVVARLVNGESTDFNVMTRRQECSHTFNRFILHGEQTWRHKAAESLLFVAEAPPDAVLLCRHGHYEERLGLHDCLHFSSDDKAEWQLSSDLPLTLFSIGILHQDAS